MKIQINVTFLCMALVCLVSLMLLTQTPSVAAGSADGHCKELNNVNCYVGRNEGNYCNSKDQTKALTRWYYDKKGVCRPFSYRGCNGNRNRFCTQESCETRCGDQ